MSHIAPLLSSSLTPAGSRGRMAYRTVGASTDAPTVSWATGAPAAGTDFTVLGDPASSNQRFQIEMTCTGTELRLSLTAPSSLTPSLMVWVDDQLALDTQTSTTSGSQNVRIAWPAARTRKVRVGLEAITDVRAASDGELTPTPTPQWRIALLGDSFIAGSSGARSIAGMLGSHLTNAQVASCGIGGTGWRSGAARSHFSAPSRMAQIAAWQPHIVVVYGSWNDGDGAGDDFPSYIVEAWWRIVSMPCAPWMLTIGSQSVAGAGAISPVDDLVKNTLTGRARWLGHASPRTWLSASDIDSSSHPTSSGRETWGSHIAQAIVQHQPKGA